MNTLIYRGKEFYFDMDSFMYVVPELTPNTFASVEAVTESIDMHYLHDAV